MSLFEQLLYSEFTLVLFYQHRERRNERVNQSNQWHYDLRNNSITKTREREREIETENKQIDGNSILYFIQHFFW